jgi:hypothetical protein
MYRGTEGRYVLQAFYYPRIFEVKTVLPILIFLFNSAETDFLVPFPMYTKVLMYSKATKRKIT